MKLKNYNALVSGASAGIGHAIAFQLAKDGAHIYLVARSEDKLKQTKKMIEEAGGQAEVIMADLSNTDEINRLIQEIKEKTDRLDIIANVAGIWHGKDEVYAKIDYQNFDQKIILDTYFVGTIAPSLLIHGLLPILSENGRILNISGTFSKAKGWLPYYVSKRAIEDLTIGLANELENTKIKVNCISPSDTATEEYAKYFPQYMKDAIAPEKIAEFAVRLCSADCTDNGEVFVMEKNKEPYKGFHS